MGKINRQELFKILDEQHERCKSHLAEIMDDNIQKLHNYHGDVIDIKTEIILGQDLEHSLFRLVDEDYYDKQKLLSVPKGGMDPEKFKVSKEQCYSVLTDSYNTGKLGVEIGVTAPKHKKKYLIKLNKNLPPKVCDDIALQIAQEQFIVYNQDTIEQIITLDVE